jgi:glycine/D-amino acid oxidase-like deaminating enzyme
VESYSIPCSWRTTTGVHGYYSPELFKTAKEVVKKVQEEYPDLGANIEVVTKRNSATPSHLRNDGEEFTLDGLRIGTAEGAIVELQVASFWPYKLVTFLLERLLAARGFNLQTNTPVTSLERANISAEIHSSHIEGWIVHTLRGDISAHHVLLATNAYTSYLLPQFADIIVPVKGQVSSLKPPPPAPSSSQRANGPLDIGHTYWFASDLAERRDDYLIQCPPPGAELILGGGRIHAEGKGLGVWDDSAIDEPVARYLKSELSDLMDLLLHQQEDVQGESETHVPRHDLEPTFEWSGIMGFSRDGSPWVGPVPESAGGGDGLWICAGYTGNGMPNAALCAKAVANMIISGREVDADHVDLPPEYLLTEDRLEKARKCDTIAESDKKGTFF